MPPAHTHQTDGTLEASAASDRPEPLSLEGLALFLDLDGVLAPISARPEDVGPEPGRTRLLKRLQAALGGRLAVISGRTIADLDRILDRSVATVAGIHGLERRRAGGRTWRAEPSKALEDVRAAFEPLVRTYPGVEIEDKGLSIAVHHRAAPEALNAIRQIVERLTPSPGLTAQWGHMVAELRTPGPDKGDALAALMAEPPFAGARPVFVGDDLTDEHGFAAAEAGGGFGVLVGPRRPTRARARLDSVEAVRAWLSAALPQDGAA